MMHYEGARFLREGRRTFPAGVGGAPHIRVESGASSTVLTFGQHQVALTNVTGYAGLWVLQGRMRLTQETRE